MAEEAADRGKTASPGARLRPLGRPVRQPAAYVRRPQPAESRNVRRPAQMFGEETEEAQQVPLIAAQRVRRPPPLRTEPSPPAADSGSHIRGKRDMSQRTRLSWAAAGRARRGCSARSYGRGSR